MGCLLGHKTYSEYAKHRDMKSDNAISSRQTRKWKAEDREHRRKILWEEAKQTGMLYGRKFSEVLYGRYKSSANRRNINFSINLEEFLAYWQKPCHYCGEEIETIGLDRMDNNVGYVTDNIVPCCTQCNLSKRQQSAELYIERCKKVAAKHIPLDI